MLSYLSWENLLVILIAVDRLHSLDDDGSKFCDDLNYQIRFRPFLVQFIRCNLSLYSFLHEKTSFNYIFGFMKSSGQLASTKGVISIRIRVVRLPESTPELDSNEFSTAFRTTGCNSTRIV